MNICPQCGAYYSPGSLHVCFLGRGSTTNTWTTSVPSVVSLHWLSLPTQEFTATLPQTLIVEASSTPHFDSEESTRDLLRDACHLINSYADLVTWDEDLQVSRQALYQRIKEALGVSYWPDGEDPEPGDDDATNE